MKKFSKILLSSLFALPIVALSAPRIVAAVEDNSNTDTQGETEDKQFSERLEKYKLERNLRLTQFQQNLVKNKCKQAQGGGIASLHGRIKGIETSRSKVHGNIIEHLNKLVEKLKAKGIDTSTLETQIAELKTKIDTFKTDLEAYKQEIADLKEMDCTADPTAFKAALEAARESKAKLKESAKSIRDYVKNTIKPTLVGIRQQLANQEGGDDTSESTNTTGGN